MKDRPYRKSKLTGVNINQQKRVEIVNDHGIASHKHVVVRLGA